MVTQNEVLKCDLCEAPEDCTDPIENLCPDCYQKCVEQSIKDAEKEKRESNLLLH